RLLRGARVRRRLDPVGGVSSSPSLDASERSSAQLPFGARALVDCRNPLSATDAAAPGVRAALENDLALWCRAAVMACQPGRCRHPRSILPHRPVTYLGSPAALELHLFPLTYVAW